MLLALLLHAATLDAEAGAFATGYRYEGGALAEGFTAFGVGGRWSGELLFVTGSATGLVPLNRQGAGAGLAGSLRLGLHFTRFDVSLGPAFRADLSQLPLGILPSATVAVRLSDLTLRAGLLDRDVGPIARLGVEYGWFSAAYAFPFGGELGLRIPLTDRLSVSSRVWGYQLFNSFNTGAVAGLSFTP